MSKEIPLPSDKKTCPECFHVQPVEAVFCQKCGKPFSETNTIAQSIPSKSELQWRQVKKKITHQRSEPEPNSLPPESERTCPKCNTKIESTVLEQCPLCMEELPPLPPKQKENLESNVFHREKNYH